VPRFSDGPSDVVSDESSRMLPLVSEYVWVLMIWSN